MADGWLPSFVTPADAAQGRSVIEEVCAEHGRSIEHDHYGVLVPYAFGRSPTGSWRCWPSAAPTSPTLSELVPTSWDGLTDLIGRFVDVGTSKFVVLPLAEPGDADAWVEHLTEAAEVLLPLETHTDELSHRAGSNVTVGGRAPRQASTCRRNPPWSCDVQHT